MEKVRNLRFHGGGHCVSEGDESTSCRLREGAGKARAHILSILYVHWCSLALLFSLVVGSIIDSFPNVSSTDSSE